VRELRNVIERAVILARGGALDFDLPVAHQPLPGSSAALADHAPQPEFLTEAELQRRERDKPLARSRKSQLEDQKAPMAPPSC